MHHRISPIEHGLFQALETRGLAGREPKIRMFDGRGRHAGDRLHRDILDAARLTAGRMRELGIAPGERVVVCLPTGWDWMDAWFGALAGGAWPVAISPAAILRSSAYHQQKIDDVLAVVRPALVICPEGVRDAMKGRRDGCRFVSPNELASIAAFPIAAHVAPPETTAYLQLTSGSTGRPRAVEISGQALFHNVEATLLTHGERFADEAQPTSGVFWLPLHHDLGLVELMGSLVLGRDIELHHPREFLTRPDHWLKRLACGEATLTAGPNFGYQYCVERVRDEMIEGLCLSRCKVAMIGAEMVRPETVDAFVARFGKHGFAREAFQPAYGMAETTLIVTADRKGLGPRTRPLPTAAMSGLTGTEIVCCGEPIADTKIAIRGANGLPVAPGSIGEVCVKGPGVFSSYFGDGEATGRAFADGWFRTGDLGLMHDGELYLTGRLKDVMIVRGENVMPHEVEQLADAEARGGGACRSAAFTVAKSEIGEQVILVVEIDEFNRADLQGLEARIRSRVGSSLGFSLSEVIFVERGSIPRTTSGKTVRGEANALYLQGRLHIIPMHEAG